MPRGKEEGSERAWPSLSFLHHQTHHPAQFPVFLARNGDRDEVRLENRGDRSRSDGCLIICQERTSYSDPAMPAWCTTLPQRPISELIGVPSFGVNFRPGVLNVMP